MELYVRFVFTLAVGLAGMGIFLKVLLDGLLEGWDVGKDLRGAWRVLSQARPHVEHIRAEDILLELERGRREAAGGRQPLARTAVDRRREELRDVREADSRLSSPAEVV